jgi:CheY-like chemotaxis protein
MFSLNPRYRRGAVALLAKEPSSNYMAAKISVLIAEDDENDRFLYDRALKKLGIERFQCVEDGHEAINYLRGQGQFVDRERFPFPDWLLLDLKMPRVDGFQVLEWIKNNPSCKVVPTVIFSSSRQPIDVQHTYDLGVNAYFVKPLRMEEMVKTLALIENFWMVAERPAVDAEHKCS